MEHFTIDILFTHDKDKVCAVVKSDGMPRSTVALTMEMVTTLAANREGTIIIMPAPLVSPVMLTVFDKSHFVLRWPDGFENPTFMASLAPPDRDRISTYYEGDQEYNIFESITASDLGGVEFDETYDHIVIYNDDQTVKDALYWQADKLDRLMILEASAYMQYYGGDIDENSTLIYKKNKLDGRSLTSLFSINKTIKYYDCFNPQIYMPSVTYKLDMYKR